MRIGIIYRVSWSGHAMTALRDAGLRRGGARRAVVDFLEHAGLLPLRPGDPRRHRRWGGAVGVASVYRALDTLADLHLVQRVDVGDGIARFEPFGGEDEHHHHLVCDDCGRVEPFTDGPLEQALAKAAGRVGYAMQQHEVVLRGTCGECVGEPMVPPRAPSFTAVTRSDAT